MTPAIDLVCRKKLKFSVHQYDHDESAESYGLEATEKLSQDATRVFKTLILRTDSGQLAVAVVPVCAMLNLKAFAKVIKCKKVTMAQQSAAERSTGYVLGGISPLAQKRALTTVLDQSVTSFPTIYVSAGRRGLELELSPNDLVALTRGKMGDICQR